MVQSIGADQVIDYTQQDFTNTGQRYDVLFDAVGNHSLFACLRVLNPKGICIVVTGPDGRWIGPLARFIGALAVSPFVSQTLVPFIARLNKEDLAILMRIESTGEIRELVVAGDCAYCWTQLSVVITPRTSGAAMRRSGPALTILRKKADGAWVVARDANMLTAEPKATA